ncbi:alpha-amylase family glycosyl hydrolase [Noviherbaspirillum denitrificans]|uniref:Alpha-glucosidase n=1 Tax=Noviherbaspirillum denitrificans TaxID=1968433 RepID=A0A254TGJ6_9BURK|nr:alpha-amylase family glycosyl hydrolase [Noviherbaspirillum denitrificans]OWW21734.1 alpha-glucosidase [Noviherbaspirillum denitrificans]
MIIYQVYPRSFADSNNDGIGDLAGIELKLPYIKSLGVDAIWISPFFKSPMKDFGYDVSDYRAVDPIFGTMDDFKSLMRRAKSLGLGVIVDMVISHTSEEHSWFKQSRARENNKSDWYLWSDPKPDGSPPNNWVSVFGGPAWRWDAERRQYYFHSFLSSQPDLNMHNLAVQDAVLAEMDFWLDMGVTGFRFDACNHVFQDELLRNNPPRENTVDALHPYGFQVHLYDQGRPEMLPFLERIRKLLDAYGAFSLAEVGGVDPLKLMGQYTQPGRLHSAYSFALMRPDYSAAYVRNVITTLEEHLHPASSACYAMSNHDKPRVATRWLQGRDPVDTAKAHFAMLLCMRGDICLYQGEELGLPQADVPFERLQDPFGISFWPKFKGRDGCRTPMPWTDAAHGGFSTVEPWLPVDASHRALNVEEQEANSASMLHFAREMIALRQEHPALMLGHIDFFDAPDGVLAFRRHHEGRVLLCVFNMDGVAKTMHGLDANQVVRAQHARFEGGTLSLGTSGFALLED